MDAITLLKADHATVEKLFKRFERAGEHAFVEKRQIVDRIIEELSQHAAIEEQLFYPVARATVSDVEDISLESLEEHHLVKFVLSELERMDPSDERFDAKVTVLIENVRHHVEEEEGEFFPKVRAELGRNSLSELGDALATAKRFAPTHPHPGSPDTPPGNLVVGAVAGVVDRIGDTASGIAQGSVSAVQDLIARILRRERNRPAPTGSSVARRQAEKVRSAVADTTDAALDAVIETVRASEDAVQQAATTANRTATTAKRGAKRTATTAKRGAKRTATTAKRGAKRTATTAKGGAKRTATTAKGGAKRTATSAKGAATTTRRAARSATADTATSAKRAAKRTAKSGRSS